MRAAGARPLYPEAGLWGVGQEQAPALRAELQDAGQLVDVTVDTVRPTQILKADETAPEPFLPVQYMFDAVGTAGLESPPGGEADGVLVIDSGLDITHPDFADRPGRAAGEPAEGAADRRRRVARHRGLLDHRGRPQQHRHVGPLPDGAPRHVGRRRRRHPHLRDDPRPAPRRPAPLPRRQHVVRRRGLHAAGAAGVVSRLRQRPDHRRRRGQREPAGQPGRVPGPVPARADRRGRRRPLAARRLLQPQGRERRRGAGRERRRRPSRRPSTSSAQLPDCDETSQWCAVNGTSFSAPIASAATAWVWAARPELEITQVFDLVRFSARDVGPKGFDRGTGFGVINVKRALARKAPRVDPQEPNDDIILVDGRLTGKAAKLLAAGRRQLQGHPRAARLHRGSPGRLPRRAAQGRSPARDGPSAGRRRRPRRLALDGALGRSDRGHRPSGGRARPLRARRLQARHRRGRGAARRGVLRRRARQRALRPRAAAPSALMMADDGLRARRFCPWCAAALRPPDGARQDCTGCGEPYYHNAKPCVAVLARGRRGPRAAGPARRRSGARPVGPARRLLRPRRDARGRRAARVPRGDRGGGGAARVPGPRRRPLRRRRRSHAQRRLRRAASPRARRSRTTTSPS